MAVMTPPPPDADEHSTHDRAQANERGFVTERRDAFKQVFVTMNPLRADRRVMVVPPKTDAE